MKWELFDVLCPTCQRKYKDLIPVDQPGVFGKHGRGKIMLVMCDQCMKDKMSPEQWVRYEATRVLLWERHGPTLSSSPSKEAKNTSSAARSARKRQQK